MKRTFAASLILLTALCAAAAAQNARGVKASPRLPGAGLDEQGDAIDRLLERNELAEGGTAKRLISSRIMRGRVEISAAPVAGSYEVYEKAPRMRLEVLNAPAGQFLQGDDGKSQWAKSPWNLGEAVKEAEGESREEGATGARTPRWRRYFTSASIRGTAVVDGRDMVVLAATPKGEKPVLMYFDAETWLLRKQEFTSRDPKDENPIKAVFVDGYASVDGVKLPSVYRHIYEKYTLTFRIYEVKHNVPIDDALFRVPNGK